MTNNTPEIDQLQTDDDHDFTQLYNAATTNNDRNDNDDNNDNNDVSLYPTDGNYCKYYTPTELTQMTGHENKQLSMFSINCRSINANWDPLNELISNMSTERFHFDFIGLTEVFKVHSDFNYSIAGYHDLDFNVRDDLDDDHGGVGLYINANLTYSRRDDLSIFIPHIIETLFLEVKVGKNKSIIVGVIYRPNSAPLANIDTFTESLAVITSNISKEKKDSYIMGDFNMDLLKFRTHEKTNYFLDYDIEGLFTTDNQACPYNGPFCHADRSYVYKYHFSRLCVWNNYIRRF